MVTAPGASRDNLDHSLVHSTLSQQLDKVGPGGRARDVEAAVANHSPKKCKQLLFVALCFSSLLAMTNSPAFLRYCTISVKIVSNSTGSWMADKNSWISGNLGLSLDTNRPACRIVEYVP